MKVKHGEITLVRLRKPHPDADPNELLQWFGRSLGLFGQRDKDKSCFRLFIELLKSARERKGLSSDQLAYLLGLSRGTVVHHLNTLMESGLVVRSNNQYYMREASMTALVEKVREDLERGCDDLRDVAEEIDRAIAP